MPNIDYKDVLENLKDAVLGSIKDQAGKFLEENKDAKEFVEERAKRLVELGKEYLQADTDAVRESVSERLQIAQQSIRTQLAGVAVSAEIQSRAVFGKIVEVGLGVLIRVLPTLVAI